MYNLTKETLNIIIIITIFKIRIHIYNFNSFVTK